jgi:WS/DGAT/MGAT family acyltransferase
MSNVDVAWLRMEHPTNLMVVSALLLFDQPLDYESLCATVEERLLAFRRFRQRVVRRGRRQRPRWEWDRRFALSSHLRRLALPAPGDDRALQELVSDLMSTPLDDSKPLWQIHLIDNYDGGCAVLARIHHCIGDGIALMRVLMSLTDRGADAQAPDSPRQSAPSPSPDHAARPRLVSRTLSLARLGTAGSVSVARLLLREPDPDTVFKGELGVAKRALWSAPIELAEVKRIGAATGATVNDVLVAAVSGALRGYLRDHGEPVDLCVALPVNLRSAEPPTELGNRFGLVFLALPVHIADPLERLFAVRRRMDTLKATPEARCALGILDAIGRASARAQRLFIDFIAAKTTGVVTNLRGPTEPIYLAGTPVRSILFWVPQTGRVSLGISILSYAGEVRVGVAVDRDLVPRPELIVAALLQELEALSRLLDEPPLLARAG